jgi:hypothetical protein
VTALCNPPRSRSAIFARAAQDWARMRDEYSLYLEGYIAQAVEQTCSVLLNARGRAAGVSETALFTGPPSFVAAYGSEELVEFMRVQPRMTLQRFEEQWAQITLDGPSDLDDWDPVGWTEEQVA